MNEADNQIGAMAQTSKSVIGPVPDFFPIHRHSIFHSCLDVAVTKLFWIDVRRTRRQPFNMNHWVFSQVRPHLFAPMNRGSVPYHYERPSNMPSQMFERFDHGFTIDRLVEMALIDSPRNRQSYGGRKHPTTIGVVSVGVVSRTEPRCVRPVQETRNPLHQKTRCQHRCAALFFIRGHSWRSHASTNLSSRSAARGTGSCGVQPRFRKKRLR
jgi:hypothetical protein